MSGRDWFALALALSACAPATQSPPQSPTRAQSSAPAPHASGSAASGPKTRWIAVPEAEDALAGEASYYGEKFRGRKTASGARFNPDALTAAHRTLPFGTKVLVRRIDTGKTVRVTITDRGPFGKKRRVIDLSLGAARKLDMVKRGVAQVELQVLE